MQEIKNLPVHLFHTAVRENLYTPHALLKYTREEVPEDQLGLLQRLLTKLDPTLGTTELFPPKMQRWANRFLVGADPEFVFVYDDSNVEQNLVDKIDASTFNLRPGAAWGADQNGRLVEIRPAPHRSTLHVVASMLDELRWLALQEPTTMTHPWISWPFVAGDGLGGHIHVSRVNGKRKEEVASLDALVKLLLVAKMFPANSCRNREEEGYGRPGDVRPQVYGYEYRTMPPWLSSPELAFFVLTLAKLITLAPNLLPNMQTIVDRFDAFAAKALIERILYFFKSIDDDARLAFIWYQRNNQRLPKLTSTDFKKSWGIQYPYGHTKPIDNLIIPPYIYPGEDTVSSVFNYLLSGTPILPKLLTCSWIPNHIPKGYVSIARQDFARQIGMGELVAPLVCATKLKIEFEARNEDSDLRIHIPKELTHVIKELKREYETVFSDGTGYRNERNPELYVKLNSSKQNIHISVPWNLRRDRYILKTREFLTSPLLPLWTLETVQACSYKEWVSRITKLRPKSKLSVGLTKDVLKEIALEFEEGGR